MAIKVGINGFGRIGRMAFRASLENEDIDVVSINDLPIPVEQFAHLLKYDTAMGELNADIAIKDGSLVVDGEEVRVTSHKSPNEIPWDDYGVEYVIESTGVFRKKEQAEGHLKGGAKKVVISAPAKGGVPTFVMGVNNDKYDPENDDVVSNASCTTNCIAPMAKVLNDSFGIESGQMTTIHAYTSNQNIQDGPHKKDLRRARAAAQSIIPTSTGAAKATTKVIPDLEGKMDGMAMRVPTIVGSITDFVALLQQEVTKEEINNTFKEVSEGELTGILEYTEVPLVSSDYIKNPASCILDGDLTNVIQNKLVKVLGWYDNEWGYSCRVLDLITYMKSRS